MAKAKSKKKSTRKTKKRESKQRVANRCRLLKFFALLVITFLTYIFYCFATLPDIEKAVMSTRQPSTTITAENGNEVMTFGNIYSEVIMLDELPEFVPDAIVATEDRRFYSHFGFDIISFTRAMATNILKGRYAQGGSTISQQVAKNLFLTPQKSIKRKVQELILAFWLEHKFTKEQILTLYLNRVYLGSGTYGIEAASNKYFQKTSRDLNLKEAAIIAGMLKAPSRYNPISSAKRANERAKVVLSLMLETNQISSKQMKKALVMRTGGEISDKVQGARHFADWTYSEVNAYIGEREVDIYVSTTLDQEMQQRAEKVLTETIKTNKNKNVTQGAVVILDKSGAVKAMVGGVDYNKSQFNRATQSLRQPGSAFKPFVYITALQNGYTRDSIITDAPISIGKWKPENYDKKYYGEVSLDKALTQSLNLATINLSEAVSRTKIIRNAKKMGLTTDIANTPSLALGTFEVKVIDMAVAYSAIANGGYATWPYTIKEIFSRDGEQLYQREIAQPTRIIDENIAHDITGMLKNVIDYGTGKKAQIDSFAAGKTGTSQDYRDAWFVGFNNDYICAVWVGNDNNSPMKGVSGSNIPAEIWRKIMKDAR